MTAGTDVRRIGAGDFMLVEDPGQIPGCIPTPQIPDRSLLSSLDDGRSGGRRDDRAVQRTGVVDAAANPAASRSAPNNDFIAQGSATSPRDDSAVSRSSARSAKPGA